MTTAPRRAETPAPSDVRSSDRHHPARRHSNRVAGQRLLEGAGQTSSVVPPLVMLDDSDPAARKDLKPFGCGGGAAAAEWTACLWGLQVLSLSSFSLTNSCRSRPSPRFCVEFCAGWSPRACGLARGGASPQAGDPRLRPVWRAPPRALQPSEGQGKFSVKLGQEAWRGPEP